MSWSFASAHCATLGGHLLDIDDDAEMELIMDVGNYLIYIIIQLVIIYI